MATTATVQARIVKNGGPITSDVYKSYYLDGTAAKEDWAKGELVYLDATNGAIVRGDYTVTNGTFGTAAAVNTNASNDPVSEARRWFVTLAGHDSSAEGKSVYVALQEILTDTVLEFQCAASSTTAPLMASYEAGQKYGAYVSATGVWGIDIDIEGAYGFLVVQDKDSDTKWMVAESAVAGTAGSGKFVRAKFLGSLLA